MNREKAPVLILSILAMALLLTASLAGIITDDGGDPYTFTSLRGEDIEIYGGQGIYQNDSIYKAVLFRGFDWVGLLVCFPLFVLGIYLYQRGRLMGQLLLGSVFTYFAYIYLIGVMGNAFNSMFLVWTGLFSTGLFGLALVLKDLDILTLPEKLGPDFPQKGLSIYTVLFGLFLPIPYLAQIIPAYTTSSPPMTLDIYTTLELAALEIGIMIPLHIVGGVLLWRKNAWGYIISILVAFAAAMTFTSLSVAQLLLTFSFHRGSQAEMIQMIVFAVITSGFSFVTFRRMNKAV
ncbi:MAG: hypothetical protein GY832_38360 [Chloroflexi bacterium]|nr:hypothetical protein [Chloroflexota bacterium]